MRLKKYPKYVKFTCIAAISCGVGWLCYQVKIARHTLTNALDTSILNIVEPTIVEKLQEDKYLKIQWTTDPDTSHASLSHIWKSFKFALAKRLLFLATNENKFVREKAVRQLAKIKNLDNWQYSQLADSIDPRTAVGLARTDADSRLFANPPLRYLDHSYDMLVIAMRDLLLHLHTRSHHPCMGYFISKAFVEVDEMEKYSEEFSSYELKKYIQSTKDLLPMCLESLLHHASVGSYAKDIAALNGLPLLMEIYNRFKDNLTVTATISRIISYLSMHHELLEQLHFAGWISILAEWTKHEDVRISIPAVKALANLDSEENSIYLQRLYPLHPQNRTPQETGVDVIFVHGLLGGVFFTWRQRQRDQTPLGLLGKTDTETLTQDTEAYENNKSKAKLLSIIDPEMQELIENLEEHICKGHDCKDFDIVWEDIPTKTNDLAPGAFCTPEKQYLCNEEEGCFTNCWPRDWLGKDCERLRIIGINYETNLSLWTPMCPVEKVKTLEERSEELIEQLNKVGVGQRPVVWVAHSMGGLIVKCLLNKSAESQNKEMRDIFNRTRGIVFYSTPHVGSSVAKFNPASALVIWPSIEVQELKKDSPQLTKIHETFLDLIQDHPMKIITFVETLPTVVSAMKFKFLVVEPESGNPGCGEYYEIPLDHLGICKPASRHSFLYQKVLNLIRDVLKDECCMDK